MHILLFVDQKIYTAFIYFWIKDARIDFVKRKKCSIALF